MSENVEYRLSLKDMFSDSLNKAKKGVDDFLKSVEDTQGKVTTLGSVMRTIGAAAAGLAIGAYLKDSVTAFNEAQRASAQLDATLRSTAGAVGVTREAMDAQAESMMRVTTFDDDAITGSQALLATFKNIQGEMFTNTIPAIADLATKMGTDLNSATLQVGKAMNDPIKGLTMLGRAGIQFSDAQEKTIKTMVETGRIADAQTIILSELNSQFGGSAAAAAATYEGQMAILQNRMGNVQETIGGVVVGFLQLLVPAVDYVVTKVESLIDWMGRNRDILEGVGLSVGILTAGYVAMNVPLIIATVQTGLLTAAQWLLNAALTANPIGIVVVAIAAFAGAFYVAYQRSETFRGIVLGVWEVLKGFGQFVISIFKNVGEILAGVFTLDPTRIKEGVKGAMTAYKDLATNIDDNFKKGQKNAMTAVAGKSTAASPGSKVSGIAAASGLEVPTDAAATKGSSAKSVTGSKSVTVNVTIGNLVDKFTVQSTNITESPAKIREMIAATLIGVVNDSQIVAGT